MKKEFIYPIAQTCRVSFNDVIATSGGSGQDIPTTPLDEEVNGEDGL